MAVISNQKTEHNSLHKPDHAVMDQWLDMFALLVHDLESPLATMKYLLRILDKGQLDQTNQRHRQIIDSSRIAVERAESILYDTMAVARAGKLGIQAKLEAVQIDTIINDVVTMATVSASERKVALSAPNFPKNLTITADPALLKRTLDNLIYNAIRHTPENGTVLVSAIAERESVQIQVKDSGEGFGDTDPNELFERYGQITKRVQGAHRGVGLGLYFCTLAVNAMHGTISAANHPDGGAVFTLRLPDTTGGKP